MPPEPPRERWWLARRVLVGGLGVVLLSAAATVTLALNEVGGVVEALRQSTRVKLAPNVLAPTSRGGPETLLLVGNDERPPPKSNPFGKVLPHSNEMLLVRIDPNKPTISMLSIPRELRVTFTTPKGLVVTNRINSAFTYGGIELMTQTIKRLLGVPINHVFVLTFPKFRRAVDEMGCVYMTVDRRYYHVNEPGGEQYFEINLQPGYQRLCGKGALEYVANRHEDTSLIRDSRDQRFLLEMKSQFGPSLFEHRARFEHILGRAVETDLHGTSEVLDLLALLVEAQGRPVRQVPFAVSLLPAYDTATPQQIHEAVENFLGGTAPIARNKVNAAVRASRAHRHSRGGPPPINLTPTTSSELAAARSAAPSLPFPLEYPRARDTYAGAAPDTLRVYDIRDQRGRIVPAYVIVIDHGPLGQFFDVQGTSWADPPLLSNPGATVRVNSRTYDLYYAGEEIRTVAWHEGGGAYWIENTLTNSVQPREMLAMAVETTSVISGATAAPPVIGSLSNLHVPPRRAATASAVTKVGTLLAILAFVPLFVLAWWLMSRRHELGSLRAQVSQAMALEATQRARLREPRPPAALSTAGDAAAATGGPAPPSPPTSPRAPAPVGAPATPAAGPATAATDPPTSPQAPVAPGAAAPHNQPKSPEAPAAPDEVKPAPAPVASAASVGSVGNEALAGELAGRLGEGDVGGGQDDV
jgi:polyisoprenyl-teichoic acid--peptidoglycan teichoic acid transferase